MLAIFDIDGVVADVRHRLHHLARRRAWLEFFDAAAEDPLLPEGADLALDLARQHEVVWVTGRPEWLRDVTKTWLSVHGLPGTELHMRPNSDYRPARSYKLGVLRELRSRGIAALVDDDDEVVRAALDEGYPAILADWVLRGRTLRDAQDRRGRT